MKNYVQEGNRITAVAPVGGVVSGSAYLIGDFFGVALVSADASTKFTLCLTGVFELPKKSADNIAAAQAVYWDNTNKEVTITATDNTLIGAAIAAAAASTTKVQVRLNGTSV